AFLHGTPLLVQACSPCRRPLTERLLGLVEEHAQILAGRTPAGQAGQRLLGPAAQLLRERVGHPGRRYGMDGVGPRPEQLGVQVSAALRLWLGLLDRDAVCFGPSILADPGDLPADLDPAGVGADGELVVLDLLRYHRAGELADHGELIAEI